MIYLFDDKESRQQLYGWTDERFGLWSDSLIRIKDFADFLLLDKSVIFREGNIILYHESFATCIPYKNRRTYQAFHKTISDGSSLQDIRIVIFSGSITSRAISDNIAHVPVTDMYANLECFLGHHLKGETDFKYLLWGEEYEVEQTLIKLVEGYSNDIYEGDTESDWSKIFFASAQKYGIDAPVDCTQEKLWLSKVSDKDLDDYVEKWFAESEYNALYIPLCFGKILSDYNGLRLAIHIRCTPSINRNKPIYIYSPVPTSYLVRSQYFDILKTRGVKLINMHPKKIIESLGSINPLTENDIKHEMGKIQLPVPQNYEDSHSIANEWAIYRWATATDSEDSAIEKITNTIKSNLYFKHLTTIYPPSEIKLIKEDRLKFRDQLSGISDGLLEQKDINLLYVDDEADKGWYEIMANIIYDVNNINGFDYLGESLKALSQQEIIDKVVNRVKEDSANIVLLDFRLHKKDHDSHDIEDITSVQILKKIKALNAGIQVIIFSATNKVWNLLALQKYGADGFIIKEGPENSKSPSFTTQTIDNFINTMSVCISNRYKKEIYQSVSELNCKLKEDAKKHIVDKGFQKAVELFYAIACLSLPKYVEDQNFDHSFMNFFRIIEAVANEQIDAENPEVKENEKTGTIRYYYKFRGTDDYLMDYDEEEFSQTGKKLSLPKRSLPFVQKLYNLFARLGVYSPATYEMVQKRNNLTHPNLKVNSTIGPITLNDVLLTANISFQCIRNMVRDHAGIATEQRSQNDM